MQSACIMVMLAVSAVMHSSSCIVNKSNVARARKHYEQAKAKQLFTHI